MSMQITDDCINCGACLDECPNHAIYEGGTSWSLSVEDYSSSLEKNREQIVNPIKINQPLNEDIFYIVQDKCTECCSICYEPQCLTICPIECIIKSKSESKEELIKKIQYLHKSKLDNFFAYNENRSKSDINSYNVSDEFKNESYSVKRTDSTLFSKIAKLFK
jgi:ferredoxin